MKIPSSSVSFFSSLANRVERCLGRGEFLFFSSSTFLSAQKQRKTVLLLPLLFFSSASVERTSKRFFSRGPFSLFLHREKGGIVEWFSPLFFSPTARPRKRDDELFLLVFSSCGELKERRSPPPSLLSPFLSSPAASSRCLPLPPRAVPPLHIVEEGSYLFPKEPGDSSASPLSFFERLSLSLSSR